MVRCGKPVNWPQKGGCAGMSIHGVCEEFQFDEVIEVDIKVNSTTAQMFLFGTEIDYESGLLESGFKFINPNVSETCGRRVHKV